MDTGSLERTFRAALTVFDATLCRVATSKGAVCVDLRTPFNGPRRTKDAAPLLQPDHVHPNKAGHDLIAATVAAAGFAPLT
jgi:lysophospholipase L1-like esterase